MGFQDILRAGVAVQSVGLLGENVRVAKKKRKSARDLVGLGVTNIVGSSLLGAQSDIIGSL